MFKTSIICDACGDLGRDSSPEAKESAEIMRTKLRRAGWRTEGKRDFCKSCWDCFGTETEDEG